MLFEWRSEKIQKKKSRRSDSAEVDGRGSGGVSLNDLLTCFFSPWQNHVLHQRLVNPMWLMESLCLNRHAMDLFSSDASSSPSSSSSFPPSSIHFLLSPFTLPRFPSHHLDLDDAYLMTSAPSVTERMK